MLAAISEESVADAAARKPHAVISFAVATHVHPDDFPLYMENLCRCASAPGAWLRLNAAISPQIIRWSEFAWSRPIENIAEPASKHGLVLESIKQTKPDKKALEYDFTKCVLMFRRPKNRFHAKLGILKSRFGLSARHV